jgi:hypothetical protein
MNRILRERKNDNAVVGGDTEEIKEANNEDDDYLQVKDYDEEKETALQQFLFQHFRDESKTKLNKKSLTTFPSVKPSSESKSDQSEIYIDEIPKKNDHRSQKLTSREFND